MYQYIAKNEKLKEKNNCPDSDSNRGLSNTYGTFHPIWDEAQHDLACYHYTIQALFVGNSAPYFGYSVLPESAWKVRYARTRTISTAKAGSTCLAVTVVTIPDPGSYLEWDNHNT